MRDYSLEVVSKHSKFNGEKIVPYYVDGIDTIGVWGEEPFELRFTNHTNERLQVRLSVDGTDVLTVKPATTDSAGRMFIVRPHGTLSLEAWPETTEAGARFIFGKTANSVAANTHGDLSAKGIIAAAVFTEAYIPPPVRLREISEQRTRARLQSYDRPNLRRATYGGGGVGGRGMSIGSPNFDVTHNSRATKGGDVYKSLSGPVEGPVECAAAAGGDFEYISDSLSFDADVRERSVGPAVGAGEMVKQALKEAAGLVDPRLDRVISMRYIWWDDLKAKLGNYTPSNRHPSGFKDQPQKLANLGNTPRIDRTRGIQL